MGKGQKIAVITLVVILIAAIIVAVAMKKQPGIKQAAKVKVTNAPAGQVIGGFPTELLIDASGSADQSYAAAYNNANQYTVKVKSASSEQKVFTDYLAYFNANGYKIVNKNQTDTISNIYATKGTITVNVVITHLKVDNNQTFINITYVK